MSHFKSRNLSAALRASRSAARLAHGTPDGKKINPKRRRRKERRRIRDELARKLVRRTGVSFVEAKKGVSAEEIDAVIAKKRLKKGQENRIRVYHGGAPGLGKKS